MILTPCVLEKVCDDLRRGSKMIVTTNGCFDIIHAGHVQFLKTCKSFGDVLIVGVNSDKSVSALKGPTRPINPLNYRMAVLDAIKYVDIVTWFDETLPNNFLEKVKPTIHIKGGDYDPEKLPERKVIEKYGGKVKIVPLLPGISTTNIVEKIKNQEKR